MGCLCCWLRLLAYLGALGYDGVCKSKTIAADIFELPFGTTGRKIISALIMVSSLGSIHATPGSYQQERAGDDVFPGAEFDRTYRL